MSFFTAVMASDGRGWRARDVDVEDLADLADLADTLRGVSLRDQPVVAVIEREDQWFALLRVDGDEDVRGFVSDAGASASGHYAELLAPVLEQGPDGVALAPADADDVDDDVQGRDDVRPVRSASVSPVAARPADPELDGGLDDDLELDADAVVEEAAAEVLVEDSVTAGAVPLWAGDPDLLADFGCAGPALVELVDENPDDPAAVLADVGDLVGFGELLEALR